MRIAHAVAALALASCHISPSNENEPHYGSECQIIIEKDGEAMPIGVAFNHDLGESPNDDTRLTLDVFTYENELLLGEAVTITLEARTKYQLVISHPFSTREVYVRHTGTGAVQRVTDVDLYGSDPEPEHAAVNVVLDYVDPGAWLNVLIGSEAEHGLRIFVQNAP